MKPPVFPWDVRKLRAAAEAKKVEIIRLAQEKDDAIKALLSNADKIAYAEAGIARRTEEIAEIELLIQQANQAEIPY